MDIQSVITKYNTINDQIKILQENKKKIERALLKYLSNKPNKTIEYNNKKYFVKEIISKEGFSQKYIEDKLGMIIKNKEQVKKIMIFLKENRKETNNLKLYSNNI